MTAAPEAPKDLLAVLGRLQVHVPGLVLPPDAERRPQRHAKREAAKLDRGKSNDLGAVKLVYSELPAANAHWSLAVQVAETLAS